MPGSIRRTGLANASFRGFADYMRTPESREPLQILIDLAIPEANGKHVRRSRALAMPPLLIGDALTCGESRSGTSSQQECQAAQDDAHGPGPRREITYPGARKKGMGHAEPDEHRE